MFFNTILILLSFPLPTPRPSQEGNFVSASFLVAELVEIRLTPYALRPTPYAFPYTFTTLIMSANTPAAVTSAPAP